MTNAFYMERFVADLHRWILLVPKDDADLFEEASRLAWGEIDLSNVPISSGRQEHILYLQDLLKILISQTAQTDVPVENDVQSGLAPSPVQLQEMDKKIETYNMKSSSFEFGSEASASDERCKPRLPQNDKFLQNGVLLVMAGAIFGCIFAFILSE